MCGNVHIKSPNYEYLETLLPSCNSTEKNKFKIGKKNVSTCCNSFIYVGLCKDNNF